MRPLLVLLAVLCAPLPGLGQPEPENLSAAIDRGDVAIIAVTGSGASSGNALTALLLNPSGEGRRFSVWLRRPLFFRNTGAGQNMIATRVLRAGGAFYRQGETYYIDIEDGELAVDIDLWSYCVDFDKENPASTDKLELRTMPLAIWEVAGRISAFEQQARDFDYEGQDVVMKSAQIALWLSQGIDADRIYAEYPYAPEHLEIARLLLEED